MRKEYRVVWKRKAFMMEGVIDDGLIEFNPPRKTRRFLSLKAAKRFTMLLGPAPWDYFGKQPEDYLCCPGDGCGCKGKTYEDQAQEKIDDGMPEIEYIRIEVREVGKYVIAEAIL